MRARIAAMNGRRALREWTGGRLTRAIVAIGLLMSLTSARANLPASPDLLNDGPGGATCTHFDLASGIRWLHAMGDWRDADERPQGERPFALVAVADTDQIRAVEWDITTLARGWGSGARPNFGILLRPNGGTRGATVFHSREAAEPAFRPVLEVTFASGRTVQVDPATDTYLVCSTAKSVGNATVLHVGSAANAVLRFVVPAEGRESIARAVLRLTTTDKQFGATSIGIFALDPPLVLGAAAPKPGLAERYTDDRGIGNDVDVLLAEDFESSSWASHWSHVGATRTFEPVAQDPSLRFEPLHGNALRVNMAKGSHLGLNITYDFRDKTGAEPEEIYFRYYLRLGNDWRPSLDGGKLPGIAATYDRGGWGGRRSDGENGWSMRGGFAKSIPPPHPLAGRTLVGTYAYHPDVTGSYGEFWPWSQGRAGTLQTNRWYCIEQYVKVNTPGQHNGSLRVWIDGTPSFDRTDIRFRDTYELRIERIWLNIYHGGTSVSPFDQHAYLDNIVVAKRYIGPMRTTR